VFLSHSLTLSDSLCVCVTFSRSVTLCFSLSLTVTFSVSLSLSGSLSLSLSLSHTHCYFLTLSPLFVRHILSFSDAHSLYLFCVSLQFWVTSILLWHTFSPPAYSIIFLSRSLGTTFSRRDTQHDDTQHNGIQHNDAHHHSEQNNTLSIMILNNKRHSP